MRAFIPITIIDSMLISSTVAEPDASEPAYDVATTYAELDQVSVVTTDSHLVYESLVAGNVGNPVTDETKWILKGNTNRFRMFDYNQGMPSIGTSPMTVVLRPGRRIDSLMLDGLKASLLDITVRNGIDGDAAYTLDGYLLSRAVTTWYEYFFAPFIYTKTVATFQIPPVADPVIYLTLSDPSGLVELGRYATGQSIHIGDIEWNPIVDSDNYSEITWDEFGKATLTPVPSIPTNEHKILTKKSRLNAVRQFRDTANAKAVVWSGLDDMTSPYQESLVLFGVYRNFQIDISNQAEAVINLSLKGI
ncbi:MAG: hypothetical protein K2Q13_04055 [Nitrosomonas sp.]|uniref:hypothetical protein n=1 Tax=Nitrosomonas sp. TaxID=42353 RepID=UPI0025DAEE98|nr:hypothetical protein [Nitrosomonas sp.]MBY0474221.1 hypothetical protein [Nitrosomonas sp.]